MEYKRNTAIEMISKMHVSMMNKALKVRLGYDKMNAADIIENETYIANNVNSHTKHLGFGYSNKYKTK